MKKLIIIMVLFVAGTLQTNAQQEIMTSQYMFNGLFLNPAYAGSHKYFSSSVIARMQWVNFEGAPRTGILAIDGPLMNQRMGIGLTMSHEKIGVTFQTDIYANYSYFIKIGRGKLGLGIKAGISHYAAKVSELVVWDDGDQVFMGTRRSAVLPKFGMGAYYFTDKWYAGFSVPTLLAYDPEYNFNGLLEESSAMSYHYFLNAGYAFTLSPKFKLIPSFLMKFQEAALPQFDINLNTMYNDMISLGVSYRTQDAVSIMAQFHFKTRYRIGYAYDITTTKMSQYSAGSHEIMIGIDFGKDIIKTKTPRYF